MTIKCMPAGPLGTNCYIVQHGSDSVIVDPGGDAAKIIDYLTELNTEPNAILLTHAHFDHIGGVSELRSYYQINVYLHENEETWLEDPALNGSLLLMGSSVKTSRAEHQLSPGKLQSGNILFDVIHTPGHSPGSVSLICHNERAVISGDVLFNRGIGRTDLPGGNITKLEQSIRSSLYQLPDSYKVYPGHGPETTIGYEKQNNPHFPLQ